MLLLFVLSLLPFHSIMGSSIASFMDSSVPEDEEAFSSLNGMGLHDRSAS